MKVNPLFSCLLVSVFSLVGCQYQADLKFSNTKDTTARRFIHPPLKGVDVPFEHYTFLAEQGDTIFPTSGSILLFPPNSIVDKNGNPVRGKIDISYREFSDPVDFFVAGIPMEYEENGTKYVFESSGMCELQAFSNGSPVYVNKKNKPQVNLASKNADTSHNLYVLDTVQKRWIVKGKDVITDLTDKGKRAEVKKDKPSVTSETALLIAPVKPRKASPDRPVISIEVDPNSIQELLIYNNLKFEIDKKDNNWDPKYSNEEWSDVKLEPVKQSGLYLANFSNASKKVSFLVRPVFEGKDYEEAMKVFKEKNRKYKERKTARLVREKESRTELESQRKALRAQEKTNQQLAQQSYLQQKKAFEAHERLIQEENKRIEALNAIIRKRNSERREDIERKKDRDQVRASFFATDALLRTFEIDGFGIWNCDEPLLEPTMPLYTRFTDNSGKEVYLEYIAVIYKNLNGICNFNDRNIRVLPNSGNMIWGVYNNKLYYLTFDEFNKCNINTKVREYTFTMHVTPAHADTYAELKKLMVKR